MLQKKQKQKVQEVGGQRKCVKMVMDCWSGENKVLANEVQIQAKHYRNLQSLQTLDMKLKSDTMQWIKQQLLLK